MALMTLEVQTRTLYIELTGGDAKAWPIGGGLPCYEGPIEGLDADTLAELTARRLIRPTGLERTIHDLRCAC